MITLKEAYKDYFYIGAACHAAGIETHRDLLTTQFSSMTCENEMKHESLAVAPGKYDFSVADKMVSFAKTNGMQMRGHCFVWHAQTAPFMYQKEDGSYVSRDELILAMKNHIKVCSEHFGDQINAYDVVNEAIDDKHGLFLRKSFWTEIIGDDFIDIAFKAAYESNPDKKLFYNDYNETDPVKCEKIVKLIKGMQERDVPVSGLDCKAIMILQPQTLIISKERLKNMQTSVSICMLPNSISLPVRRRIKISPLLLLPKKWSS